MANYYISDLHFMHNNVVGENGFDGRPYATLDEMHEDMIAKWNAKVTNGDHVFILGDVLWKENEEGIALISRLKGNKHLILGNHDRVNDLRYKNLFIEITNYREVQDTLDGKQQWVVLSHFPIMFWNHNRKYRRDNELAKNYAIHLYGHAHNSVEDKYYKMFLNTLNNDGIVCEAYNVGCMMPYMNYEPRTLKEIIEGANA